MPISLQVQMMRHAISPRFAIRIFLNLRISGAIFCPKPKVESPKSSAQADIGLWTLDLGLSFDSEQRLAILDRLPVLNINLCNFSGSLGLNLIHQFHRLDNADHRISFDDAADFYESIGGRRGGAIKRADDGRRDAAARTGPRHCCPGYFRKRPTVLAHGRLNRPTLPSILRRDEI